MRVTAPQGPLDGGENAKIAAYSEHSSELPAKAPAPDDEGLALEEYAEKYLLSESEVWRRIRRGELLGRTQHGRLLIYPPASMAATLADLPPLPNSVQPTRAGAAHDQAGGFLTLSGERSGNPELALLLDHLSLAKEENREILRLTQDSLRQVSQMADQLVQMKDAVITAKDHELEALKQQRDLEQAAWRDQLAARDREIARLQQHSEDLEMLARSMGQEAPSEG